jgi:hypothetical protein
MKWLDSRAGISTEVGVHGEKAVTHKGRKLWHRFMGDLLVTCYYSAVTALGSMIGKDSVMSVTGNEYGGRRL